MSNYTASLTPLRGAVAVAGISSSIFFLGNVTNAYFGVVPAIQAIQVDKKQRAQLWLYFYERAKVVFFSSALVTTASFGATIYFSSAHRVLASVGFAASAIIGPFTAIQMQPVNDAIKAVAEGDATKEAYVDALVEKWRRAHLVRLVLGGIAYVSALALAADVEL